MKRILYSLGLLCLIATAACNDDNADDNKGGVSKPFDWENHEAKTGMMEDKGSTSLVGEEDSHYNFAFQLTDATSPSSAKASFNLYLEAFSAGSAEFETGNFSWFHPFEYEESELDGKGGFWGALYVDGNGDGDLTDLVNGADMKYDIMGGSLKVSGNSPNYTIEYNVTLDNNKTLSGSYSGKFIDME